MWKLVLHRVKRCVWCVGALCVMWWGMLSCVMVRWSSGVRCGFVCVHTVRCVAEHVDGGCTHVCGLTFVSRVARWGNGVV